MGFKQKIDEAAHGNRGPLQRLRLLWDENAHLMGDVIPALAIGLCSLKLTRRIDTVIDLPVRNDEGAYIEGGRLLLEQGFGRPDYGPLYKLYYFFLLLLQPNTIHVFYVNCVLLSLITAVLTFLLLRRLEVNQALSFVLVLIVLASGSNLRESLKVNQFALVILMAALACATYHRGLTDKYMMMTLGSLLASYVRPEFFAAFLVFAGITLFSIFIKPGRPKSRAKIIKSATFVILVCLLLYGIGKPFQGRGFLAFKTYYGMNHINWSGSSANPWYEFEGFFQSTFGNADSILEAAKRNPAMFAKHLYWNLKGTFYGPMRSFDPCWEFTPYFRYGLFVLLLIALVIYIRDRLCHGVSAREENRHLSVSFLLVSCSVLALTQLSMCVLMIPDRRYTFTATFFIGLPLLYTLGRNGRTMGWKTALFVGLCVWLAVPVLSQPTKLLAIPYINVKSVSSRLPYRNTCELIRSLHISEPVTVLEGYRYHVFLTDNFKGERIRHIGCDIASEGASVLSKYGVVISSDDLYRSLPLSNGRLKIENDLGNMRYDRFPVRYSDTLVFVRRGLLKNQDD